MADASEHDHSAHGHDGHDHDDHDHEHDHDGHDHTLIIDRLPAGAWQIDPKGSEVLFKARAISAFCR